ncbi:hypothetical protein [Streptomyces sp. NPDC058066]|uniref:hypothetical protein n=1 Tax=Streptomyces sp. NPDC058066 TaxID=3346323 RepID=UPI0036E2A690
MSAASLWAVRVLVARQLPPPHPPPPPQEDPPPQELEPPHEDPPPQECPWCPPELPDEQEDPPTAPPPPAHQLLRERPDRPLLSDVFPLRALPEPPADDTATTMPTITSPKMMAPMITALTFLSFPRERPRRA